MATHTGSPRISHVAVIGAGGNLGPFIVAALKRDSQFKITVITRKSSASTFTDPDLALIRVSDEYPSEEMESAFKGQDAVVATFNHRSNAAQNGMVDAAVRAGVKRFIPADFGSNGENEAVLELFPFLRGKKATVDYCRSKSSANFSWTSIVTGLFIDMAMANGFMGFDLKNQAATIWGSGNAVFSCSACRTIGATVAAVLKQPEKTANRYVYTSSMETSQHQILDDMIAQGREGFAKGDFVGASKLALAASYSGQYGGDFSKDNKLDNDALGVPRESLSQVISEVLDAADVLQS